MKVIIFDIFGDYAHFRRFYTTSSPLSFAFPPPPTVYGMIASIIGIDKKEYLKILSSENCKISLQILKPIRKIRLGLNLINTKGNFWQPVKTKSHDARTQVKAEFIKEPRYRIYFHHKDELIMEKLIKNLKNHESFFTFSLGLSELLGDFQFIKIEEFERKEEGEVYISSIVPISQIADKKIIFEEGKRYFRERIPVIMNTERIVEKYDDVIFESNGKPIKVQVKNFYQGEDETNVLFF